jgi:hypothetical protein
MGQPHFYPSANIVDYAIVFASPSEWSPWNALCTAAIGFVLLNKCLWQSSAKAFTVSSQVGYLIWCLLLSSKEQILPQYTKLRKRFCRNTCQIHQKMSRPKVCTIMYYFLLGWPTTSFVKQMLYSIATYYGPPTVPCDLHLASSDS